MSALACKQLNACSSWYVYYIEFGVQKYPTSMFTGLFFGVNKKKLFENVFTQGKDYYFIRMLGKWKKIRDLTFIIGGGGGPGQN